MRVCRICDQFPPIEGGLSSGMLDLSLAQHKRGHELIIITRFAPGAEKMDAELPFPVIRIPCRSTLGFGLKAYKAMKAMPKPPDVVHTHGPSTFTSLLRKKPGDPPFVHTAHAVRKYQYGLFRDLPGMVKDFEAALGERVLNPPRFFHPCGLYVRKEIFLEKQVFRGVDHILVVADYFADQIRSYYGIPRDKISTSYNGSNFDKQRIFNADPAILGNLEIDKNQPVILYVGRVDWVKRVHLLVETMPRILEQFPDACLLIAGKGNQEQDLRRLISKLRLEDSVKLLGWIPHAKLAALFKIANCFCLPSYWEGLSKSLLEAMSTGVPVAASDNLANREVLQSGDFGWLVSEASPDAWSEAISGILSNGSDVQVKVSVATDLLDKAYRWHNVAERVESAYAKVLNGN